MADLYVYGQMEEDYSTAGLVGSLQPRSATFVEEAGGTSELLIDQPYDRHGKWRALVVGNIVQARVPTRTTPEINDGKIVTSVEVYTTRPASQLTKAQRYLYKSATGTARLRLLPGKLQLTVVSKPAEGRWKVKSSKYGTGWVEPEAISFVVKKTLRDAVDGIEDVEPSWYIAPQLFEIQSVVQGDEGVTATALHISYQLLKEITNYTSKKAVTLQAAVNGILQNCTGVHDFSAQTDIADKRTGVYWEMVNPIEAMMDPEQGVVGRWGAQLVRDNWTLYFLHRAGRDRGVRIEYGKNLAGIQCQVDTSNLITRVIPVGEQANGKPLYLSGTRWIDSAKINNYAHPHVYVLQCEDCKVTEVKKDKKGNIIGNPDEAVTPEIARANMRKQAQDLLATGCDLPEISMSVEYRALGETEEYRQYRELEKCYLYDEVTIHHHPIGLDVKLELVRLEWDAVADRPERMEFGTLHTTAPQVASWQIPSGISGTKLIPGSVSQAQVADEGITTRHLQADSVNTDALQSGSVTADILAAGAAYIQALEAIIAAIKALTADDITAGTVETNTLAAAFAHLFELVAEQIRAGSVTADTLSAVMASLVSASVGTLDVGYAHVKDLDADEVIITDGVAGALLIERLVATSAMMASATLGELVVRGEDGLYYEVAIQAGGTIGTREVTVSEGEIAAGQTAAGRRIVETEADIQSLNATDVRAQSAVIASIFTSALTAGRITAGQALISSLTAPELYVTAVKALGDTIDISANRSISLQLGAANDVRRWIGFDNASGMTVRKPAYIDDDGVAHGRSKWYTVTDERGFHIKHEDVANYVGSFHEDELETRNVRIGEIVARRTATGGWAWTD